VRLLAGWLCVAAAVAQGQAPIGLVRGQLLECDADGPAGELSVRTSSNQVFRFAYDAKTYFEREKELTRPGLLRKGELLEIVADQSPESSLRYARTVHVLEPERPRPPWSAGRFRAYRNPIEEILPLGNLTFAGVVCRLVAERLVLRTRADGEKIILLRSDTRYVEDGAPVTPAMLKPNMRVFIRAERNLDNEIEAYQVVWGEILQPGLSH